NRQNVQTTRMNFITRFSGGSLCKNEVADWLHSKLLDFFVVVLTVEDVPFLTSFQNGAFLAFDFLPGRLVNSCFLVQQVLENFANFQADRVAVLDKAHFVEFGERVGHRVRDLIYLVTAQPHSTALYFRTSSRFTSRNMS